MNRETVILSSSEVASALDIRSCIEAVEGTFGALGRGLSSPPGVLGVHVEGGGFHVKTALLGDGGRRYFAAKTNGNFPSNPVRNGLPSIQGVLVLCDADVGTPLLVADSSKITELRTAAATAVAVRHLSRGESRVVTLIGCGAQAPSHLRALAAVRSLERFVLFDLDTRRAEELGRRMRGALEADVQVGTDLGAALALSDVCVTCTSARQPILGRAMVRPGTFVAAVGADNPNKHEIAPDLMAGAKVVTDSVAQCAEIGDLHHAIAAGVMSVDDVHADLGAVVAGLAAGREHDDEVIVFDSTGLGIQDAAAAAILYERAVRDDQGLRVRLDR